MRSDTVPACREQSRPVEGARASITQPGACEEGQVGLNGIAAALSQHVSTFVWNLIAETGSMSQAQKYWARVKGLLSACETLG